MTSLLYEWEIVLYASAQVNVGCATLYIVYLLYNQHVLYTITRAASCVVSYYTKASRILRFTCRVSVIPLLESKLTSHNSVLGIHD